MARSSKLLLSCRFHPQAWINDYAVEVDSEGPTDWQVEWPVDEPLPMDDQYESDDLRHNPNAPEWVQEWYGPFWVEIRNRDDLSYELQK